MRVFLAIPAAEKIRERASEITLKIKSKGIKTVKPENMHFTAKFFGEVSADQLEEIKKKMEKIKKKKATIKISGAGTFPNESRIKIIWLGVKDGKEDMLGILGEVNAIFPGEKKKPVPHMTIARVRFVKNRKKLMEDLKKVGEIGKMEINEIVLYQSILKPEGPEYVPIKRVALDD